MSRGSAKGDDSFSLAGLDDSSDSECPICHTKRYLRRDMRFLINPECYHKMCESCVDRIFKSGPAQCPVAGCHRTLRRNKFRIPTFGDLQLEREVDIRKRVSKVFNRREDEFDSLIDYNNYLNDVEDLTFNMIHKIDIEEAEAKLKAYKDAHDKDILENIRLEAENSRDEETRRAAEQEGIKLRRQAALRLEQEERREREEARLDIVNRLASGDGDAAAIAREGQRAILKKARNRHNMLDRVAINENEGATFEIRGLRKRPQNEPEKPFDPFGGLSLQREYYVQQEDYSWQYFDHAKTDPQIVAGGYDVREYYTRALCEAFSGLGVIFNDEMAQRELGISDAAIPSSTKEARRRSDAEMNDVF